MSNTMDGERPFDFYQEDDESVGLKIREYLLIIRKRLPIIITILTIVFAWKLVDTYSKTPIFTASSDVLIEKNQGSSGLEFQYLGYDPTFLSTQTEIIKSENVAARVVKNLELDKKYKRYFFSGEKEHTSLVANIKSTLKALINSVFSFAAKDTGAVESTEVQTEEPTQQLETSEAEAIAQMVRGGLDVVPIGDTKIVTITYSHTSPVMARIIADATVQAYKDVTLDIKLSSSNYALQWMTEKAEEERKKLEAAENALQKYMRDNDLVTVEDRLAVIPQKLSEISTEFTKAQTERKELEEVYQQIKNVSGVPASLESIPLFANNNVLQTIREKIFKAKQNIKDLSKKYGYKHPLMIKAKDELQILNNEKKFEIERIVATTKNSYELAKSREEYLGNLFTDTKGELLNVNEKFVQYSIMKREVDTNRVLFDALTSNIKKASVTEQAQSVNIWVVKKAELPWAPSYPNKRKELLMALIIGLTLGVGLAFTIEFLDNTVKSEKDLTVRFDMTILGTIEQLKGSKENIDSYVVDQPLSPLAESYRLVRSNLLLSSAEHHPRTILITSMGPKEGKTSTTVNVARMLSQDDKKVLIIDCDLRKPRMHTLLGLDNKVGLSNFLTGNVDEGIVCDVPGEAIKFIPSGLIPPNPAELLSSAKMRELVESMASQYDFVLLDSPPIQRVTDSLAVSQIVDGTIVVVRARKTTYDMLASGMRKMQAVNAHILGFVLNGMHGVEVGSGYYAGYNTYYAKDTD